MYDKKQLLRDCELHNVPFPFDDEHLNLKNHAAARMGRAPKGVGKVLARLAWSSREPRIAALMTCVTSFEFSRRSVSADTIFASPIPMHIQLS
jgi:hypothetical protein